MANPVNPANLEPWRMMGIVTEAAMKAGIESGRAFLFLSELSALMEAEQARVTATNPALPTRPQ